MSLTKRAMENEQAVAERTRRDDCECVYDWDSKLWKSCEMHAAEEERELRELEAWD